MQRLKSLVLTLSLVLLLALEVRPVAAQEALATPATAEAAWLFVLSGQVVAVTANQLVVAAEPRVIAFTDRPERKVRLLTTEAFVDQAWATDSSFRQDPPNAALTTTATDATTVITIVDVTRQERRLTLTYQDLSGAAPKVGDDVALVIDASGDTSHAEGEGTTTSGDDSHAEGD
jgi:hypothetical protein